MTARNDEEEERRRQRQERKKLPLEDQLYGPKKRTAAGTYSMQHNRRTGRLVPINVRVRPKNRHIIEALMHRDKVPTIVLFMELMIEAYEKVYGSLDEGDIPSDEEIIDMYLKEQDKRDADPEADDDK